MESGVWGGSIPCSLEVESIYIRTVTWKLDQKQVKALPKRMYTVGHFPGHIRIRVSRLAVVGSGGARRISYAILTM